MRAPPSREESKELKDKEDRNDEYDKYYIPQTESEFAEPFPYSR